MKQSLLSEAESPSKKEVVDPEEVEVVSTQVLNNIVFKLDSFDFRVKRGQLLFVIGKVASGKSSLIYSLLGEMKADLNSDISLLREDKVAVLSQSPWILGRTVRENILLGLPFDEKKFKNAIRLSQF